MLEPGLGVDAFALRILGDSSESFFVRHECFLDVEEVFDLALREAEDLAAVVDGEVAAVLNGDVAERHGFLLTWGGMGTGTGGRC